MRKTKRETLKKIAERYYERHGMLSCIGDNPATVKRREERDRQMQRVRKLMEVSEDCETPQEFLSDIALAKEIVESAMGAEKFF